jgi:hypothetical protein
MSVRHKVLSFVTAVLTFSRISSVYSSVLRGRNSIQPEPAYAGAGENT